MCRKKIGLAAGVPDLKVIRPSGFAGRARDYSQSAQHGKRVAAIACAQAQPLAQAHWKL
jgi:hypothetical protein